MDDQNSPSENSLEGNQDLNRQSATLQDGNAAENVSIDLTPLAPHLEHIQQSLKEVMEGVGSRFNEVKEVCSGILNYISSRAKAILTVKDKTGEEAVEVREQLGELLTADAIKAVNASVRGASWAVANKPHFLEILKRNNAKLYGKYMALGAGAFTFINWLVTHNVDERLQKFAPTSLFPAIALTVAPFYVKKFRGMDKYHEEKEKFATMITNIEMDVRNLSLDDKIQPEDAYKIIRTLGLLASFIHNYEDRSGACITKYMDKIGELDTYFAEQSKEVQQIALDIFSENKLETKKVKSKNGEQEEVKMIIPEVTDYQLGQMWRKLLAILEDQCQEVALRKNAKGSQNPNWIPTFSEEKVNDVSVTGLTETLQIAELRASCMKIESRVRNVITKAEEYAIYGSWATFVSSLYAATHPDPTIQYGAMALLGVVSSYILAVKTDNGLSGQGKDATFSSSSYQFGHKMLDVFNKSVIEVEIHARELVSKRPPSNIVVDI